MFHQVGRINESEVQSWGPEPPNSHQPHMCISFRSASCGPVVTYFELIYWGSTKFNWWNWELHSSSDGRKTVDLELRQGREYCRQLVSTCARLWIYSRLRDQRHWPTCTMIESLFTLLRRQCCCEKSILGASGSNRPGKNWVPKMWTSSAPNTTVMPSAAYSAVLESESGVPRVHQKNGRTSLEGILCWPMSFS